MKIAYLSILSVWVILSSLSPAFANDVDDALPAGASEQLKASTRLMIKEGIESHEVLRMTRVMAMNRFREENIIQAQRTVMDAKEAGLPVDPIMNKAFEGIAKRVREEGILQAMEKVRSRYAFAYAQAKEITEQESQRQRIGDVIAESLTAGLTEYDTERVLFQLKYRSEGMSADEKTGLSSETFMAVREMARLGVSSVKATELACEALKQRYTQNEMSQVRKSFMVQARKASANVVAEGYANAIRNGQNVDTLDFTGGRINGVRGGGVTGMDGQGSGSGEKGSSSTPGGSGGGRGGQGGSRGGAH